MKTKHILLTTAALLIGTAAHAATWQVPYDVDLSYMNIRSGPGTNYSIVGRIPAGATLTGNPPLECRPRQDGHIGYDFCHIRFNGVVGWVSQVGLQPVNAQPAPATYVKPDLHGDMVCGAPTVFVGDDPNDTDPVVGLEVNYDASSRNWQVFHHHSSGLVASRSQQYAIEDLSDNNRTRWGGSLNRNRSLYMVAQAGANYTTGEGYYEEWLYNRSQGNRLDMHMRVTCRVEIRSAQAPAPVPQQVPVPAPYAPVCPILGPCPYNTADSAWTQPRPPTPQQQGPTTTTVQGPTQQNGPIVVTPPPQPSNNTNNITIVVPDRVVPGTTYSPTPKAEAPTKADGS